MTFDKSNVSTYYRSNTGNSLICLRIAIKWVSGMPVNKIVKLMVFCANPITRKYLPLVWFKGACDILVSSTG